MTQANLVLRFCLEVAGVVSLGVWGFQLSDGADRWIFAVGAPAVAIALWAFVIAPGADVPIAPPVRELLGSVVLLAAAGGLFVAGQPMLAGAFAALIVLNTVLLFALRGT